MSKYVFEKLFEKTPQLNLRKAAKAYLNTAIKLYIKLEGQVSIWDDERFGDSANLVCSLSRTLEHLLKLRLLKIDPLLLYPLSNKVKEYCRIKQIKMKNDKDIVKKRKEREMLSHTVTFKEALARVDLTQSDTDFNFRHFEEIYALRNSLEHHWDRNEEFLKKVVGKMSSSIIPCLKEFIKGILREEPGDYFDEKLLDEVGKLDRAIEKGHSLELQRRFEEHLRLYKKDPNACRKKYHYPDIYSALNEEETDVDCPVCKHPLIALWDVEVDYDVEGSSEEGYVSFPVGAFPDTKCLYCANCHFCVDSGDVDTCLPTGLDINLYEDYFNDYY